MKKKVKKKIFGPRKGQTHDLGDISTPLCRQSQPTNYFSAHLKIKAKFLTAGPVFKCYLLSKIGKDWMLAAH